MEESHRITPERFEQGLSLAEFVQQMEKNRDLFEANYRESAFNPEQETALKQMGKPLKVLAIAEDWCGDAVRYVPVLARMAEIAGWEVRVFTRDDNPDLAHIWPRNDGKFAIPVFAFFDEGMNEVAHYVEKPQPVYEEEAAAIRRFAAEYCYLPDAVLPYAEMRESTQALYSPYIKEFRNNNKRRWQAMFAADIISLLSVVDSGEVAHQI